MQFLHLGFSSPHFMRRLRQAINSQFTIPAFGLRQICSDDTLKHPVFVRFLGPLGGGTFLGAGSEAVDGAGPSAPLPADNEDSVGAGPAACSELLRPSIFLVGFGSPRAKDQQHKQAGDHNWHEGWQGRWRLGKLPRLERREAKWEMTGAPAASRLAATREALIGRRLIGRY
jgi:hypothetical protein